MLKAALAIIWALSSPVLAAECQWQSADGDQIYTEPGAFIIRGDGPEVTCTLRGNGTSNPVMTAICGSQEWAFFTVASRPGGDEDVLIFQNSPWYLGCSDVSVQGLSPGFQAGIKE